jgi:NADH:ubiquinone reductase (H+-translocating)
VRRFPRLRRSDLRWVLVDVADQVLAEIGPFLGRRALAVCRRRGMQVRLRTTVEEVTQDAVRLSDGETLRSYTLIWVAGIKPEPVIERLGLPLEKGRLRVEATLQVPDVAGVYALGDAAAVPDPTRPGRLTAPTGQHAQRQGRAVARNVSASLGYGPERPYRHHDLGQAVDLGRFSAVPARSGCHCGDCLRPWSPVATTCWRCPAPPDGCGCSWVGCSTSSYRRS